MLTVAAMQMTCSWDMKENIKCAEQMLREVASKGAQIILIQELFETPYFDIEQSFKHLELATTVEDSRVIKHMANLAKELSVVLTVSWFERAGNPFFNSLVMIDADGSIMGVYRKAHIPNAIGYQEKQYFSPEDTGFKVWDTHYVKVGIGICWDQ
jgi:N-carbamoylputrescine amidase